MNPDQIVAVVAIVGAAGCFVFTFALCRAAARGDALIEAYDLHVEQALAVGNDTPASPEGQQVTAALGRMDAEREEAQLRADLAQYERTGEVR